MKRLPHIIKSNEFAVAVAIASMLAQSKHTFQAFLHTESINPGVLDIMSAVLVAIVIDLAILFYTLRKRKDIALGAMIAMIIINSYAYWVIHQEFNSRFFAGLFFSVIIPVSVYYYAEEVVVTRQKKEGLKRTD